MLLVIFMQLAVNQARTHGVHSALASYKPPYYARSGAGAQSRLMGASRASPTERLVASCFIMNGLQKAHFPVLRSDSEHAAAPAARAGFWSHMEQPVTHAALYSG